MIPTLTPILASILVSGMALTLMGGTHLASASEVPRCFANWSEAAPIVKKEALVDVADVSALARTTLAGAEVVKTTLCADQGRYVYRLIVREPKGQVKMLLVDARKPFAQ
jgi:hypothetical protein